MRFLLYTIGCKINQYETQALREAWANRGYQETAQAEDADLILVNSCAVTSKAVQDLRNAVRRFHRSRPQASILITGCAAQVFAKELSALPGVHAVIPQSRKAELAAWPDCPEKPQPLSISTYFRSRAVLKVQDGCSHRCTYCIVPLTRGPSRSRKPQEIVAEAKRLLASGAREITLSGINLRQFGRDLDPRLDFWDLLLHLESAFSPAWHGRARFRISSLEPSDLSEKALDVLSRCRLVCPHLHLSLQSGSPAILRKMGRGHYSPTTVASFLENLQSRIWPLVALGADILVGFPGETEKDFQETYDCCAQLPLTYAHVFPFSPRPGTPAAKFGGQVPVKRRKERVRAIQSLVEDKKATFLRQLIRKQELEVVLEGEDTGRCEYYVQCVLERGCPAPRGSLIRAVPRGILEDRILVAGKCQNTRSLA